MLSVPCGLPSYVGPWPPVRPGAEIVEPFADLARSTPHSASASGGGDMYGREPGRPGEPAEDGPATVAEPA